jgi:transcriptional regulator with XRE-family HTH domain
MGRTRPKRKAMMTTKLDGVKTDGHGTLYGARARALLAYLGRLYGRMDSDGMLPAADFARACKAAIGAISESYVSRILSGEIAGGKTGTLFSSAANRVFGVDYSYWSAPDDADPSMFADPPAEVGDLRIAGAATITQPQPQPQPQPQAQAQPSEGLHPRLALIRAANERGERDIVSALLDAAPPEGRDGDWVWWALYYASLRSGR